jgi:two-component system response regulator RegA
VSKENVRQSLRRDERSRSSSRRPQALIVDNETAARETLARGLRDRGWDIEIHDQLRTVRARLKERPAEGLIIELRLEDGPTLSLLRRVRKERPDTRIIVLTRFASIATATSTKRIGVHAYLPKPVENEAVLAALMSSVPLTATVPPTPCSLDRALWEYINRVVDRSGSIARAALALGIDRRSLRRMLSKHAPSNEPPPPR